MIKMGKYKNIDDLTVGQRIKNLRKRKTLTQQELADAIFVNIRSIQNYEKDQSKPLHGILEKLAQFFDVPVGYLMGIEEMGTQARFSAFSFLKGVEVTDLTIEELEVLYDLAKRKGPKKAKNDANNT